MAELEAQKQQREADILAQKQQHEAELAAQKQQREAEIQAQKQQLEDEMKLRMAELEAQRLQRDAEMDLNKAELKANEQRFAEEQAFRLKQDTRRKAKEEQSLTARVKKYSVCLKNVLPRMPADPGEMISFWDT